MIRLDVNTGFYRIDVEPWMVDFMNRQVKKHAHLGKDRFNPKLTTYDKATTSGFMGEAVVQKALPRAFHADETQYDFVLDGFTCEVKTRLIRTTPTQSTIQWIMESQTKKECDTYAFVALHESYQYGWVIGWVPTPRLCDVGFFRKEGERLLGSRFVYRNDLLEVFYSRLNPFRSIIEE